MKRNRRGFPKALCYLCLIIVLCLGLISIIGSNGGGGGGTAATDTTTDGDGNGDTGEDGTTSPPAFSGFDFTLSEGDFWDYSWDYSYSYTGSTGTTTENDSGTFRVTLGSSKEIEGVTAYEAEVTGKSQVDSTDLAPRWDYLALSGNKFMGSEDGTTLTTIFDAQEGAWPGSGFFASFSSDDLFTATEGTINNDYISEPAISVGESSSSSQCEYFPGVGTICGGDYNENDSKTEYYKENIGPIGYHKYFSMSDMTSTFDWWSTTTEINLGLVASSLQGDTGDYDLENEPNDSPDTAQTANLPSTIKGSGSVADGTTAIVNGIQEAEANDSPNDPQSLNGPILVTGDAKMDDSSYNFSYTSGSTNYSVDAEDWYTFILNSQTAVTITLDFQESSTADLDLYLFDDQFSTMLGLSVADNPNTGNPTETITKTLNDGTYIIAVDAYAPPDYRTDYTLNLFYSGEKDNEQEIEDWFTFTLDSQSDVTITLDFEGGTSRDFDLYLLNSSADTVLASGRGDNPTTSDFTETITETLNAGTYLIGVDAYSGSGDYTLEVE
jgi:hypothetical protein